MSSNASHLAIDYRVKSCDVFVANLCDNNKVIKKITTRICICLLKIPENAKPYVIKLNRMI